MKLPRRKWCVAMFVDGRRWHTQALANSRFWTRQNAQKEANMLTRGHRMMYGYRHAGINIEYRVEAR